MRIAGLRKLQFIQDYDVSDEVSTHFREVLPRAVNSIRYSFKVLFDTLKVQERGISPVVLQKFGITEIGKTQADGIRLLGDEFNHVVYFPERNVLKLVYLSKINGDAQKIITVKNGSLYEQSGIRKSTDFEEDLEEVLSSIDSRLLKFKFDLNQQTVRPYIPTSTEQKKLDEVNRLLRTSKHPAILDLVCLSKSELDIAESIAKKYNIIKSLYKRFNNNATQYNVRNYYKKYDSKNSTINIMSFKNIGPNGENIGIGSYTHKGENYLMIKVQPDAESQYSYAFVIAKDGTVRKNLPYETVRTQSAKKRHDAIPEYYTQSELNKLNIKGCLECAEAELEKFKNHTLKCINRQVDFAATYNNDNIGSLSEQMPRIDGIFNKLEKLKKNIRGHFEYLADCIPYLKGKNIDIEFSRRGIRLGNVTPEGYDLRITFPSVLCQRANQILIMDGEEIKKSFYIVDNKLLKLDIRNLHDAFTHAKRQRYYHSQEYIDNSGLIDYIGLIEKILKRADNIIKKSPSLEENMSKK